MRVDKDTYELVDIGLNISNDEEGILLCIIWGKNEEDLADCNILLNENWGMVVMYYGGT